MKNKYNCAFVATHVFCLTAASFRSRQWSDESDQLFYIWTELSAQFTQQTVTETKQNKQKKTDVAFK